MKILQINNNHSRIGGSDVVFNDTISILRKNGHQVVSLSRNNENINSNPDEYLIDVSNGIIDRFYSAGAVRVLKNLLEKEKPGIVHLHCIIGGITYSILPVLKKRNIPVIMSVHDFRMLCPAAVFYNGKMEICEECGEGNYFNSIFNSCSPKGIAGSINIAAESFLRDCFWKAENYVDKFIFVSRFVRDKYLKYRPWLEHKNEVLYNPARIGGEVPSRGDYFLFFNRLIKEKGIITVYEAFKDSPEIKLKVAGKGPLESIFSANQAKNINYEGFRNKEEIEGLISRSMFTIVSSECYETLSLSAVESLALGKPVIASEIGALAEIIKDGENGFLYPPGSKEGLKEALNKASGLSDEKYYQMSENARHTAMAGFAEEKYYEGLMRIYENAIANKKSPGLRP